MQIDLLVEAIEMFCDSPIVHFLRFVSSLTVEPSKKKSMNVSSAQINSLSEIKSAGWFMNEHGLVVIVRILEKVTNLRHSLLKVTGMLEFFQLFFDNFFSSPSSFEIRFCSFSKVFHCYLCVSLVSSVIISLFAILTNLNKQLISKIYENSLRRKIDWRGTVVKTARMAGICRVLGV
jgi:hypothetical protein